MDIEEQRKAFDEWVLTHPDNLDLTAYEENIMFDAWLAAKQQAVPDGFVVVPVKCTNRMAHAAKEIDGRLSAFKYGDVWQTMIQEAQK